MFSFLGKIKSFLPPLKEVLSEDGKGSYSRYMGFCIVLSTLSWITYLVVKTHALPDLGGPTLFISGGAASHYGINQAAAIFKNKQATNQGDQSGQ